jgi:hypothetical protein
MVFRGRVLRRIFGCDGREEKVENKELYSL